MGGKRKRQSLINVAIFASGQGSNALKIIQYFSNSNRIKISLVVCNNPAAGVLKIAADHKIPVLLIDRQIFNLTGYVSELKSREIGFIVLAGFLWKVPAILINAFRNKIINIHPALLPAYGGKGMYGSAVHQAVINAKENQSGITIHFVDDLYDHGKIIFQKSCPVEEHETADSLADKIHDLEHEHYAKQIEHLLVK